MDVIISIVSKYIMFSRWEKIYCKVWSFLVLKTIIIAGVRNGEFIDINVLHGMNDELCIVFVILFAKIYES